MKNRRRMGYKPATVEIPIEGGIYKFKITPDGTVYHVEETHKFPKTDGEKLACRKSGKTTVARQTLRKVKNTELQRIVFMAYLKELKEREG